MSLIKGFRPTAIFCLAAYLITLLGVNGPLWAMERDAEHPGYLSSVEDERHLRVYDVVILSNPDSNKKPLSQLIFDGELSQEFQDKYEQSFGRTSVDRNVDAPNRFSEAMHANGVRVTVEKDVKEKRKFGEYMVKRLTEHHLDGYIKTNPSAQPLYEIKQTVTNMSVKVKKGYRLKVNYSFSGNYVDLGLKNPFNIKNKVTLKMKEGTVGPSKIEDAIFNLMVPVSKTVTVETDYGIESKFFRLVGKKSLSPRFVTSISGTSGEVEDVAGEWDNRVLLGLTWNQ